MQYTKDQSNISDTDGSHRNDFFHRANLVPECQVDRYISQIQQVVAPKKNPVDGKAHLTIMNQILQINLSGLKAPPSDIYGDVRTHRKKNDI